MARQRKVVDYYRLTSSLISELTRTGAWPRLKSFRMFFRKNNHTGQVERFYPKLAAGEAAPEVIVRVFFEYLAGSSNLTQYTFEAGAVPAPPPPDVKAEGRWLSLDAIGERLGRPYRATRPMYLDDPGADIPLIVESFYKFLGRFVDPRATDEEAVRHGREVRGLSVADEAAWLRAMHAASDRAVMFAADGKVRVGAMVVIPVTDRTYQDMSAGHMRPEEITPAMSPPPGEARYLWIEALTPIGAGWDRSIAKRSNAETHTFMYQMAYHTRALTPFRPIPFGLYTHELYRQRYERFGFTPTGGCMKGTAYPIVAMRPSWTYQKMRVALGFYRRVNKPLWRAEDVRAARGG